MIFRRNKPVPDPDKQIPAPRGRDSGGGPGQRGANALARRFLVDEEPATTDLSGPAGFPAASPEPETQTGVPLPSDATAPEKPQLISHDPDTGRFYVHPGTPEVPVLLEGEAVTERTELHRGDRIRIGEAEFVFLSRMAQTPV
jgi:hypothetical protein